MFVDHDSRVGFEFAHIGKNCLISPKASFYKPENIWIGDNVRIDDFCILSAGDGIEIGSFVHVGCYTSIVGKSKVTIGDFASISGRCSIYSSTEDGNGDFLTNPMIPDKYRRSINLNVTIEKHAMLGCGCVVLPGAVLREGAFVGAMSLVNKGIPAFEIWGGVPAKYIKRRNKGLKQFESCV